MKKLLFLIVLTVLVITACSFNKPEIITYFDKGFNVSYPLPEPGQVVIDGELREALSNYQNENVRYLVCFNIFNEDKRLGSVTEEEKIKEYKRLLSEGYNLYKGKDWTYRNRLEKKYYDVYFLLLTKEEIETFKANEKYAYIFDFVRDGLSSPIDFKDCKKVELSDLNPDLPENIFTIKLDEYYRKQEPDRVMFMNIKSVKSVDKNYFILADMHTNFANYYMDLFIADENYNLIYKANVKDSMETCFSVSQVFYENKTILFGAFNDIKWLPGKDENVPVEIDKVYVKLKSGAELKEKIDYRNGCILILDEESPTEIFEIYNKKNKLQAKSDSVSKIDFAELIKIEEEKR